jgi:hypothetical protein
VASTRARRWRPRVTSGLPAPRPRCRSTSRPASVLLRLALALLHTSGFSLAGQRLRDGQAKVRSLRAVIGRAALLLMGAGPCPPLRARRSRTPAALNGAALTGWQAAVGMHEPRRCGPGLLRSVRGGERVSEVSDGDALTGPVTRFVTQPRSELTIYTGRPLLMVVRDSAPSH